MISSDTEFYTVPTHRGDLLLAAARLYRGQSINLVTPGGGFAPLLFQQNWVLYALSIGRKALQGKLYRKVEKNHPMHFTDRQA